MWLQIRLFNFLQLEGQVKIQLLGAYHQAITLPPSHNLLNAIKKQFRSINLCLQSDMFAKINTTDYKSTKKLRNRLYRAKRRILPFDRSKQIS